MDKEVGDALTVTITVTVTVTVTVSFCCYLVDNNIDGGAGNKETIGNNQAVYYSNGVDTHDKSPKATGYIIKRALS